MTQASTFAQRFEYARDRQRFLGTWQDDAELAGAVGVSASQVTDYKSRDEAPPAKRTLAIALLVGVDPGWLAFGEQSAAPAPDGFAEWLAKRYPRVAQKKVIPDLDALRIPNRRARKNKPPKRASG